MGLKLTPMPVRRLSGLLGLSGPVAVASWAHSFSKQCVHVCFPPPISLPTRPLATLASAHLKKWSKMSEMHQAASLEVNHVKANK